MALSLLSISLLFLTFVVGFFLQSVLIHFTAKQVIPRHHQEPITPFAAMKVSGFFFLVNVVFYIFMWLIGKTLKAGVKTGMKTGGSAASVSFYAGVIAGLLIIAGLLFSLVLYARDVYETSVLYALVIVLIPLLLTTTYFLYQFWTAVKAGLYMLNIVKTYSASKAAVLLGSVKVLQEGDQ